MVVAAVVEAVGRSWRLKLNGVTWLELTWLVIRLAWRIDWTGAGNFRTPSSTVVTLANPVETANSPNSNNTNNKPQILGFLFSFLLLSFFFFASSSFSFFFILLLYRFSEGFFQIKSYVFDESFFGGGGGLLIWLKLFQCLRDGNLPEMPRDNFIAAYWQRGIVGFLETEEGFPRILFLAYSPWNFS